MLLPAPLLDCLMMLSVHDDVRKRCLECFPKPEIRNADSSCEQLNGAPSSLLLSKGTASAARTAMHVPK